MIIIKIALALSLIIFAAVGLIITIKFAFEAYKKYSDYKNNSKILSSPKFKQLVYYYEEMKKVETKEESVDRIRLTAVIGYLMDFESIKYQFLHQHKGPLSDENSVLERLKWILENIDNKFKLTCNDSVLRVTFTEDADFAAYKLRFEGDKI